MSTMINVGADALWAEKAINVASNYKFTLGEALPAGDAVASVSWSVSPPGAAVIDAQDQTDDSISILLSGGRARKWALLTADWVSVGGVRVSFTFQLFGLAPDAIVPTLGTALFPNRFKALQQMRQDRLVAAASGALPNIALSDDYLWDKIRAAEAEISHELRVPLAPTRFFAEQPTDAELAALDGDPWGIDPGYDYISTSMQPDKWGFLRMRNKPLLRVERVRFTFPGQGTVYDLPADWLQVDRKYGMVQFVPASTGFAAPLNAFMLQTMGGGSSVPFSIKVDYVAGIPDAAITYPDLVDAVLKTAAMKILEDRFLPQSGSISADGLSQSISNDMGKHHESIDRILNGPPGVNGGLMAAIHGVRFGVLGA